MRRINRAISEIVEDPLKVIGDTQKPLVGKKNKGVWRRYIGNHRLFYQPDIRVQTITITAYDTRGDAYKD